jgi:two-component system, NtrC family, sensor kinase
MLEQAVHICDAAFGNIYRWDGEAFTLLAMHRMPEAFAEFRRRSPVIRPFSVPLLARIVRDKPVSHITDAAKEESYINRSDPNVVAAVELGGARTVLAVPMLKENELIGVFTLFRQEVHPFTDKQIELVKNFAAQAVIAIENARLLNELRQRTTDLTKALEQQTAMSEVLQVISGSSGDLKPVFDAILANAVGICEANFGTLLLFDGAEFRLVAAHNPPPAFAELRRRQPEVRSSGVLARLVATKQLQHLPDCTEDAAYKQGDVDFVQFVELCGARTFLAAPMLKGSELIGVIGIHRQDLRPFAHKQIELISNFAARAVIAIENARLLNELRQRTTDLTEALEQQTATSEVLQVIGSSPGDLEAVFATMLEKAVRICEATYGNIYRWNGESLSLIAAHNTPQAFLEARKHADLHFRRDDPVSRVIKHKKLVHVHDVTRERDYLERDNERLVAAVELAGIRTFLAVPLLKEDELIGTFHLSRQEVRPFDEK